ncbi:MAG: type II toxin-antitoxin system VapC family toxin [Fibromonadaceae bacterium]|jgi:predicted nucleic acid-binding protein|nr:type II toxin-antitoxin system VapC family toxin [Fibromonadaceae bacterium]
MIIAYFDSSLLMSILLEEDRECEAKNIWESYKIKISSILLKIETNISLLRFYNRQENKYDEIWLANKKVKLRELLGDVFLHDITEEFAESMIRNSSLAKCKSLDAIHLATALNAQSNPNNKSICICSFDKNMLSIAKQLGFKTFG